MAKRFALRLLMGVVLTGCAARLSVPGVSSSGAPAGASTVATVFAAPTLTSIAPTFGPLGGGLVTLTGQGFRIGATVQLGTAPCAVVLLTDTLLTCNAGANPAGQVAVKITNVDSKSASLGNAYAYGGDDVWNTLSTVGTPAPVYDDNWHDDGAGIWSVAQFIVWAGFTANAYSAATNQGALYNPTTDGWTAMTTAFAPSARVYTTRVWTGTEMVIWGGTDASASPLNSGGRYDPMGNSWSGTTQTGAPTARDSHVAVWTGSKILVWGGEAGLGGAALADGKIYDPQTDSWSPISSAGAPTAREDHTAVWTGSEMLIWGGTGTNGTPSYNSGGLYNPTTDTWRTMSTVGAPAPRYWQKGVWTGKHFIIWAGYDGTTYFNDGGMYDPVNDTWTTMSAAGAPVGRWGAAAVWTGARYLIWGGTGASGDLGTGGVFDPVANTWTSMSSTNAPSARNRLFFAWSGTQLIVWGGSGFPSSGAAYTP